MKYVISVDQSTQATKAILFDDAGKLLKRVDKKHKQLINELGHVSHDPIEIYENTVSLIKELAKDTVNPCDVVALGISNQRETTLMWDKNGNPLADAVVWQCSRARDVARLFEDQADRVFEITGIPLSPYFPACKMRWLKDNVNHGDEYFFGTVDTWLIYKLTHGKEYKTDATNASRYQLYDLKSGKWSKELLDMFGIEEKSLPAIEDSNAIFGYTDVEGLFEKPIPISGVMGDSHAALFGHGCHLKGQVKTTLGTGSSIMMNIGTELKHSSNGLVTSLAWSIDGVREFVFEGNINYAGAVISWIQNDIKLINSPGETEEAIKNANMNDETVLVPAFTGLGAPYWQMDTKAIFYGMSRTTRRNELIKAAVECIPYQITDILNAMASDSGISLKEVKADGGPSRNEYLVRFLSETSRCAVRVSDKEELSAIGVAYMAGLSVGLYNKEKIFKNLEYKEYNYSLDIPAWKKIMDKWYDAVSLLLPNK